MIFILCVEHQEQMTLERRLRPMLLVEFEQLQDSKNAWEVRTFYVFLMRNQALKFAVDETQKFTWPNKTKNCIVFRVKEPSLPAVDICWNYFWIYSASKLFHGIYAVRI